MQGIAYGVVQAGQAVEQVVSQPPTLSVNDLVFTYPGAREAAVRGISFGIAPGEVFGFLGPSGAGKSTTQKILIGLLKDYQGQVTVLGRDLKHWGSDYYARIGVGFELPNHYTKLTALENLRLFGSLYGKGTLDPRTLLEKVGLLEDAGKRVGAFSKGMQIRLNLVRALLHDPELVFLDEPTAGLDPVNARRVKDIVRELRGRGRTIFLTTHDMNVADELCDRVAFIVDGGIVLIDSPRALKIRHGSRNLRVEYRRNGATATQEFAMTGLGDNGDFLSLLRGQEVETMHTQEATLEDIFIRVTGRSLL
jgi:fluoroquinolone transport system ATP-binding protein